MRDTSAVLNWSTVRVNLNAPLNDRQLEVPKWIADGCPPGVMTISAYKTTAIALQGRRLVKVSRKQGIWRADLTDVGLYYLAHGSYPLRGQSATAHARRATPTNSTPLIDGEARPPIDVATNELPGMPAGKPVNPGARKLPPTEQLIPNVPAEDHLAYVLALFTWWPFKPDLPDPTETLVLELRGQLFRNAASGDFDLLTQVSDEALNRSFTDLIFRLLGDPDEYLSALGAPRATGQNELVMEFHQPFLGPDEISRAVEAFREQLESELPVTSSRIVTRSLADVIAPAAAALVVSFDPVIATAVPPILASLMAQWIGLRRARRIRLSQGGDSVEMTGAREEAQGRLEAWIARALEPSDIAGTSGSEPDIGGEPTEA